MSDQDTDLTQDELTTLKARADLLGITYHPSIGLDKLRAKVQAAMDSSAPPADEDEAAAAPVPASETPLEKRKRLIAEATKLVRIRLTCMNPLKKEWDGEIITVGNAAVGSLKKFIPFNAEDGWHVPHMMYEHLRDRQCQTFYTVTDSRGNKSRRGKLIREFAIEVLPPLSQEELTELARRQAMSHAVG
jgi:hypothetical protein